MNKVLFLITTILLISTKNYSQSLGIFREGFIVEKKGDTIRGLILIDPLVPERVAFKKTSDDFEKKISAKKIKCIVTNDKYAETVKEGRAEKLVTLMVAGKDSLFYYMSKDDVVERQGPQSRFTASKFDFIYWLKQDGVYFQISHKKFREELPSLLSGCEKLAGKLQSEYTYSEIPAIIEAYNNCDE